MTTTESRYLLARDVPDPRDYIYVPGPGRSRKPLPERVDLRRRCPPVQDQGRLFTCTAHAVASAVHYAQRMQKMPAIIPSRLFIYYNERVIAHQRRLRHSVNLRNALKVATKTGVCPESLWPYRVAARAFRKKPPQTAFEAAAKYKIDRYYRIPNQSIKRGIFLKHLKCCLADGYPFLFGFRVHPSFEKPITGKWKDGMMPVPGKTKDDKATGGHAVMAVGYDDRRKAVLVRNSWGKKWGIKGHFWMPYDLITDPGLAHDFWTIRGVTGVATK
jgi:C1A family cysteine protease